MAVKKKSRNHDCMSRDGKVASEIRVRENAVHHITHDTRAAGVTGMLWEGYFAQTPSIFFPSRARVAIRLTSIDTDQHMWPSISLQNS